MLRSTRHTASPLSRSLRALGCIIAVLLFTQLSGIAVAYAAATGNAIVDLCGAGCEDEESQSACPQTCPTCSCGLLTRTMVEPSLAALPSKLTTVDLSPAVSRLLGPPTRVDGDGVFHPPRA